MRLNASLALEGLTHPEWEAEDVIRQIRHLLCDLDADVYIELLAVGSDFGGHDASLLTQAEAMRHHLLRRYWQNRKLQYLHQSLRLGHTIASMDFSRIRQILAEITE